MHIENQFQLSLKGVILKLLISLKISLSLFFLSFSLFALTPTSLRMIKNSYIPGAFELFLLPAKNNLLLDENSYYQKWKSYIPLYGKYNLLEHQKTSHGSSFDYDIHIPVIMYGPKFIKNGLSSKEIYTPDITATIAYMIGASPLPHQAGEPLKEALADIKGAMPKIIVLFVIDQGGWIYLNGDKDIRKHPHLDELISKGFLFNQARLNFLPAATPVSHAVLGTGLFPKFNGVFNYNFFNKDINTIRSLYKGAKGLDLSFLKQPSLADTYDLLKSNRPIVFSYAAKAYSAIGMGGHGASFKGGDRDYLFWFDYGQKRFVTDERLFILPASSQKIRFEDYARMKDGDQYWNKEKCSDAYDRLSMDCFLGSPYFTRMEGEMLRESLKGINDLGKDDLTDLVFISLGSTDYCGHMMGSESIECAKTLSAVDEQLNSLISLINEKSGGDFAVFITADHGTAPLSVISGGKILIEEKLAKEINQKFDKLDDGIDIVKELSLVSFINLPELHANGLDIDDLKAFLSDYKVDGQPFFEKVYSYRDLE
jgi:hypothetical protein